MEENSNLPTLLRRGYVVPPKNFTEAQKSNLKNTISIEYIMKYITTVVNSHSPKYDKNKKLAIGSKIIILKSDTGSGKSTVLPVSLFRAFPNRNIIVTQPRILNAVDIPITITSINPEFTLGKNIGYITGSFKLRPINKGVMFTTIGVLTQQLQQSEPEAFLGRYSFIIIDEVHERDEQLDICFYLLKKLLINYHTSPACPVIILMSATIDADLFIDYFNVPEENYLQVKGSTFPIDMYFPDYSVRDYLKYAALKAQDLHLNNMSDIIGDSATFNKDIIIFVKDLGVGKKIYDDLHLFNAMIFDIFSKNEQRADELITSYYEALSEKILNLMKTGGSNAKTSSIKNPYYVLPILLDTNSFTQGRSEYKNLFTDISLTRVDIWKFLHQENTIDMKTKPIKLVVPSRRIIISTNLAETGVTIPTLKYCIDTGFQIDAKFFPEYGSGGILMKNISLGSAIQRRGRVGRKAPGQFYPCYTRETFDSLPTNSVSNIINNDVTELILTLLIKEKDVKIVQENSIEKIKDTFTNRLFQMHTNISNDWYKIENLYETNIAGIDLIEIPAIQSISYSFEKLHIMGFIDDNYNITPIGLMSINIRKIPIEAKKAIFSGFGFGANVMDLITIISFVQVLKYKIFGKEFSVIDFMKNNKIRINSALLNQIDDFTICLFVWYAMQNYINFKLSKPGSKLHDIRQWCINNNISFDGVIKAIDFRDNVIENMVVVGLNPFYNGLDIDYADYNLINIINKTPDIGINELIKIKKSLFEGYKLNLLEYDKFNNYKALAKNITIKVKSQFTKEEKPKYIICSSYMLVPKFNSAQYEFMADGFIGIINFAVDKSFYNY